MKLSGLSRKIVTTLVLVGLSVGLSELAWSTGWFDRYDRAFYDLWHNLAGERVEARHVALVVIDDATIQAHRDRPMLFWGPHYAKAISELRKAGVAAIGVDRRFMVSGESWLLQLGVDFDQTSRTLDGPFRKQLASGKVILVGYVVGDESGRAKVVPPSNEYRYSLLHNDLDIGLDALYPDEDGVVRHFVPALFDSGPPPKLTFAVLLALRARDLDPLAESWELDALRMENRLETHWIGFCGPPGTHPPLSFDRLLQPKAHLSPEIQALKDKVVIIGLQYSGNNDVHSTPYTPGFLGNPGRLMSGPEIHANIVETILSGRILSQLPSWLGIFINLAFVGLGVWSFFRLGPVWAALSVAVLIIAGSLTSFGCFLGDRILLVGPIHLATFVGYLGVIGFRLTGEERQRRRIHQLFGRYVSDEVVDELVRTGDQPDLGGQTIPVSILFSDIRDFTTISERLAAREVVEMLNTYFSRVTDAILAEGGTIDKFIGDAVMAIFGAPVRYPDHARRAIRAARAIDDIACEFTSWMKARFQGRDLPAFDIGIGIHTGEALIGNIGSEKRMEFTAIGDTVNTASRLEGVTKGLSARILVSAETKRAAGSDLAWGPAQRIQVKGRQEAVEVYEVTGITEADSNGG